MYLASINMTLLIHDEDILMLVVFVLVGSQVNLILLLRL